MGSEPVMEKIYRQFDPMISELSARFLVRLAPLRRCVCRVKWLSETVHWLRRSGVTNMHANHPEAP